MKVVIDILEDRYKDIQRIAEVQLENCHFKTAEQIIANGTPLPNTHGRLIDADKVKERMIPLDFSVQKWISEVDLDVYVPTIVESHKEV